MLGFVDDRLEPLVLSSGSAAAVKAIKAGQEVQLLLLLLDRQRKCMATGNRLHLSSGSVVVSADLCFSGSGDKESWEWVDKRDSPIGVVEWD